MGNEITSKFQIIEGKSGLKHTPPSLWWWQYDWLIDNDVDDDDDDNDGDDVNGEDDIENDNDEEEEKKNKTL